MKTLSKKMQSYSKTLSKSRESVPKILSIFELFCPKICVCEKKKKDFLILAEYIFNKKLSLEYLLKHYSNFEKMKSVFLNKEQQDNYEAILPNLKLEKHLCELVNIRNLNEENFFDNLH